MPLPKAKQGEKKKEFVSRCMGTPSMNKEFVNTKQRLAVCNSLWGDEIKKDQAYRIDYFPFDSLEDLPANKKFKRNSNTGFLEGTAIVTNVGVFSYVLDDGTIRNELRPPEEVFDDDSIESLKMNPVTNNHPDIAVTAENINDHQVGNLGSDVLIDQYHLALPMVIQNEQAIQDVLAGKRALSCGYTADIEDMSGIWMGVPYDAIQRNIKYNHVAIVDKGRAGDAAVIKFDSVDYGNVGIHRIDKNLNVKGVRSMLKNIKIDGVDYEAEAPVIQALTRLREENEKLKKDSLNEIEKSKKDSVVLIAERDQLKEEVEQFKKDAEEFKKSDPEKLEKAIQIRLVVLDAAKRSGVEIKSDMSESDIKKEVVMSLYPSSKEKMDKADEIYINVRFDGALERLDEIGEEQKETNNSLSGDVISKRDKNKKEDSNSAYDNMIKRDQSAWKRKGEED